MGLSDRLRTLFRLFALFTVMVAVALISAITTIRVTIRGHQLTTPNLVGVSLDTAQRITSGIGLDLKVEDKLFSGQYPANQIISQVPPRGTRVKLGQHIHVLVSLGPPRVTVPALVGDTVRAAQITAVQRGLTVGDVAAVHWPGSEADYVVAQDPPPAKTDVQSPAVNILISLGGSPVAFMCPSFVGRPLDEARRAVEKAGFKIGQVIPVPIPQGGTAVNTILSQTPQAGSKIEPETVFTFQVAAPPQPMAPPEALPLSPPR